METEINKVGCFSNKVFLNKDIDTAIVHYKLNNKVIDNTAVFHYGIKFETPQVLKIDVPCETSNILKIDDSRETSNKIQCEFIVGVVGKVELKPIDNPTNDENTDAISEYKPEFSITNLDFMITYQEEVTQNIENNDNFGVDQ